MAIDAALGRLGIRPGVCTSSTRPANPYSGQVIYETDTNNIRFWSGSAWESNKGGIISSSAPTGAAAGDIWYDSDDGRAYIYYDDGSSQQWVEFGAPPSGSTIALASYADSAARTTAIPSPTEADLSYLQDTNKVEVYDGSAWAVVGPSGLVHISRTTIGSAVSSVTVSGAFSSTYDNYKIMINGGVGTISHNLQFQLGSTTTGYYSGIFRLIYSGGAESHFVQSNDSNWNRVGGGTTTGLMMNAELLSPNLAERTFISAPQVFSNSGNTTGFFSGFLDDTTQYTDFTVLPNAGTITGGTIDVYGYAKA